MLAEMGGHAERQLMDAINALTKQSPDQARRVLRRDDILDASQRCLEEAALGIFSARRCDVRETRHVVGTLRIATDLERIGDLAKNIGKRAVAVQSEAMPRSVLRGLIHMSDMALVQIRGVLDCLVQMDGKQALHLRKQDKDIDAMFTSLFRELLTYLTEDPGAASFAIHLLFCTKNIELIGDHVAHIAEAIDAMTEREVSHQVRLTPPLPEPGDMLAENPNRPQFAR